MNFYPSEYTEQVVGVGKDTVDPSWQAVPININDTIGWLITITGGRSWVSSSPNGEDFWHIDDNVKDQIKKGNSHVEEWMTPEQIEEET